MAAFLVGCAVFLAADHDLLEGPLRTLLPPLAVLLPGALIVTGMSELAAGAMVAGTSRLVFGTVQLLLFSAGILAAARVIGLPAQELANVRVDELGPWAPWFGLVLLGVGVCLNLSAPAAVLPFILGLLALTFLAETGGQQAMRAFGGFAGGLTAALGAVIVQWRGGSPSLVVFLPSFWLLVPGSLGLIGTTQIATDISDGFVTASARSRRSCDRARLAGLGSVVARSPSCLTSWPGPGRSRLATPPRPRPWGHSWSRPSARLRSSLCAGTRAQMGSNDIVFAIDPWAIIEGAVSDQVTGAHRDQSLVFVAQAEAFFEAASLHASYARGRALVRGLLALEGHAADDVRMSECDVNRIVTAFAPANGSRMSSRGSAASPQRHGGGANATVRFVKRAGRQSPTSPPTTPRRRRLSAKSTSSASPPVRHELPTRSA